ncbi:LA_3659 family protein [Brachyspira aalborgi]|uniref:DNA recombination protein RmuC n=1 Tax=Brachyspira aalborgi TaxID=29522 RepID=A0AB38Q437_9SPIR|nr:hypothetical protein [Brachyspira aalborgi]TXJ28124.1 hypothetical protein EPJ73_01715 [Brachyspira aalborgi]
MFPILNFALMFIIPIIVVGIAKIIDNKRNSNIGNFNNIFEEEKAALEGIIEEKISEVKDNAIDLEIAVKKAGFISKSMEEDLAKLNTKEDFKNRVNNIVDENIKYSEDNKKNIVDMLHNELHKATESFNSLLEGKRDDMNKIRDELEDIMHRLEIGKESFGKTINGVYEKADNKEKELVSDIENKYNNLDKKIETLFDEKKTDLNNMSAKYHSERTFARKRAIHI